ncbi:response regulator [Desulfobacula phenolica]|uniref:Putative two-component system response regulator n=1 Tax=Desulfobacula phenolica TaxID=90732 RepID=A0A1H2J8B5_9BACT|nr:HD domain-containing phosphohydrolase [Desulfobacula phenolica]SDU52667.1 putative two-component system response regulator [Desulfobacula phenolica]
MINDFVVADTQKNANILIVDDEPLIRDLLKNAMARTSYPCYFAENGEEALKLFSENTFDVVVTDIDMPVMDGIELAKIIKSQFTTDVIVMTGQISSYHYDEIISIGASDFVEKPFSPKEMILRVNRVLRERHLKQEAEKAHNELKNSYIDSVHRLVMAAEYKDEDTGDHIIRIGKYCSLMAEKLSLSEEFVETIYYAAPMHDIGKIGIPDKILLKPGKLTNIEFETIKTHPQIGARLLSRSKSKILQMAHEIALNHHEKFNGKGYPNQAKGIDIPISGRITAIADTFDALTSKRPYKDPYPPEVTYNIMKKERGEHFDPDILDVFLNNFEQFLDIRGKVLAFEGESGQGFKLSERDKINSKKK